MKNKPNLPSWAKLLITAAVLALCFFAFVSLNQYVQRVPQPAPDTTFSAMPAPASRLSLIHI